MKKKIICIGIISMFLLTCLTAFLGVGRGITNLETLENHPPERVASYGLNSVVWNRKSMGAPFSSEASDPDGDLCKLCVIICKRGTTDEREKCSELSADSVRKSVSFSLDPDNDPIDTYYDWDMWVEDEHGAESSHWDGSFYIKRSNVKTRNLFQIFLRNHPNLFTLLRNLIRL
jgi:hypothetical protein